jgi:hypothetical protein
MEFLARQVIALFKGGNGERPLGANRNTAQSMLKKM